MRRASQESTPLLGEQLTSKMPVVNVFLGGETAMLNIGEWLNRSSNNTTDFPRDFKIFFAPVPRLSDADGDFATRGGLDVDLLHYVLYEDTTPTFVRSVPQEVMDLRSQEVMDLRSQDYEKYFLGNQTTDETLGRMAQRHNDYLKQQK